MSHPIKHPTLLDFPDEFHTDRLTIRTPRPGDGAGLCEAINETLPLLKPWMHWAQEPTTPEAAEENVRLAHARFLTREDLRLHLYLKGTETFVGSSGIERIDWGVPRSEIGYWCRKSQQGHGYITEAVQAISQFAFEQLGLVRVEIHVVATNEKSLRIPPRAGFTQEARLHHYHRRPDGQLHDMLVFAKHPK